MEPRAALVRVVDPYYPKAKTGRQPFGIETICSSGWRTVGPGEEALHDMTLFRNFARLSEGGARLPDKTSILPVPPPAGEVRPRHPHALIN